MASPYPFDEFIKIAKDIQEEDAMESNRFEIDKYLDGIKNTDQV